MANLLLSYTLVIISTKMSNKNHQKNNKIYQKKQQLKNEKNKLRTARQIGFVKTAKRLI